MWRQHLEVDVDRNPRLVFLVTKSAVLLAGLLLMKVSHIRLKAVPVTVPGPTLQAPGFVSQSLAHVAILLEVRFLGVMLLVTVA